MAHPGSLVAALVLWTCLVPVLGPPHPANRDLDIGIPPGSPISWGQRFPVLTPRRLPMFPVTPRDGDRTRATAGQKLEVHSTDSAGIVRILTWDIVGHLPWIPDQYPGREPPQPGPGQLPRTSDALYWTVTAAMMRLLLHPQLVSEAETIAHLTEIGEPVLVAVKAASPENYLEGLSRELTGRIEGPRQAPAPQPGHDPRSTMLKRFLAEELVRRHPYDPEGGFGERVFLFGEEMVPLLADYAGHEDPFLARNATAALGRYDQLTATTALVELAGATRDPVVLMRALSALGGRRIVPDPEPLVARLAKSTDRVETVALVDAVGRCGIRKAVPRLVALGEGARRDDPDLLQAVLAALVRIRPDPDNRDVIRLRQRIQRDATNDPRRFAADRVNTAPEPDRVDNRETRGEIIAQLATLLHARMDLRNRTAVSRALALLSEKPDRPSARLTVGIYADFTLEKVHPPVRFVFLEVLADLGREGELALVRVASDASVEPSLRATAFSLLPASSRAPLLSALFRDPATPIEMRVYGLDLMGRDAHPELQETALRLLRECARADAGASTAQERQLWLGAVRALSRRKRADLETLLPLMRHVVAPVSRGDARQHALRSVTALVADAAGGLTGAELRARIDALLDVMIEHKVDTWVRTGTRDEVRKKVTDHLAGLRDHPDDANYHQLVTNALMAVLFGGLREQAAFVPVVQLEEEILLAIGRTGSERAVAELSAFLRDHPASPYRAHAALALGMTGQKTGGETLARLLLSADAFTRLCAYESLRHLTGQEHRADWLYGTSRDRTVAAEKYYRLVTR